MNSCVEDQVRQVEGVQQHRALQRDVLRRVSMVRRSYLRKQSSVQQVYVRDTQLILDAQLILGCIFLRALTWYACRLQVCENMFHLS